MKRDILKELYYGTYEPEAFQRNEQTNLLDQKVIAAEKLLHGGLSKLSEEQLNRYQLAVSERNGKIAEQAFQSGFRLAMQLVLTGCIEPTAGKGDDLWSKSN